MIKYLAISQLGAKTFHVVYKNHPSALSLGIRDRFIIQIDSRYRYKENFM